MAGKDTMAGTDMKAVAKTARAKDFILAPTGYYPDITALSYYFQTIVSRRLDYFSS
jgi:hypothetical protein